MKKKLFVIVLAVVMALSCMIGLVACGGDGVEGTYYVYEGGVKVDGASMKLEDGKVTITQSMGDNAINISGTYKVDGSTVEITAEVMGVSSTQKLTIVSDGILKDENSYYCVDGKTPPTEE